MESICTRRASSSFPKKGKKRKTASSSGPETEKKGKRALSSSSSSTSEWKYEVFLSFHGPDTRLSFTDHLYDALKQKGILTFRDDEKLERGKDISQELLKAIQESLYAVVILSPNYASSKWCLKELAEIVKCKTQTKLEILPIFYDVDPSDVRKKTGTFEKAFDKHAEDPETNSWRAALTVVGNIAGWDLRDRPQATYIQKIVGDIFEKLNLRFSPVYSELVGIDSPVMEMIDLLGLGLNDVRFIGIHGMGGVGKTTLSQVIYDRVSHQFEGSSFLASVRESSENQRLVLLQKQLLCEILKERELVVWNASQGTNMIARRLRHRMVFVVLDDVNTQQQLKSLAGARNWFGPGSRIIFTSRDRHLLSSHGGGDMYLYELKGLNYKEALELFSLSAFKKYHPYKEDYMDLSNKFVNYTQGLPLALNVLGSFLCDRTKEQWRSAWDQLKVHPDKEVMNVLKISFDGLEDAQKSLFLDVACFFKGDFLDSILDILESFDYFPDINIDVLVKKSLITISMGMLCMHDLLQTMGRDIVHSESPKVPGERSRLWRDEDVLQVLKLKTGTSKVEGMVLNLPTQKKESLHVEVLSKMKKLRILYIGNRSVRKSPKLCPALPGVAWLGDASELMLPNDLRLLEWCNYPFKSLPLGFQPNNLIELNMPGSHLEQLWSNDPIEGLGNLKRLDLSECKSLTEKLNLIITPNLESLHLEGCENLSKIHSSIFHLSQLKLLNLRGCTSLQSLPDKNGLKSLERFYLSDCSGLEKLPDALGNMTALRLLYLNGTSIEELPHSIGRLSCLSVLSLKDCKKLSTLPSVFGGLSGLSSLKLVELPCSRVCLSKKEEELPCSRFQYMDINFDVTHFWRHFSTRTVIKFSDGISMPVLHSLRYFMFGKDFDHVKITAFCIGFRGRPYSIPHGAHEWLADKAHDLVCKVIYGSSMPPRIPDWFSNRSCSPSITIERHPDLNDNWKVMGYALLLVHETDDCVKGSPSIRFDFETDEGPLRTRPLVLYLDVKSNFSSTWVYIPANWFLAVGVKNVNGWSYLKVSVRSSLMVKECGARLVHEHDAKEFYDSITSMYPLGSLDSELLHHLYSYSEMDCYPVTSPYRR